MTCSDTNIHRRTHHERRNQNHHQKHCTRHSDKASSMQNEHYGCSPIRLVLSKHGHYCNQSLEPALLVSRRSIR